MVFFTHRLGFRMGLRFWGSLCFQGGLWSSVFVLGVFVFITTICITYNQPHIVVDSACKSATLGFTCWALFAVKWVAIIFSSDCSKFLNCLLWFWQTQTLLKHFQLEKILAPDGFEPTTLVGSNPIWGSDFFCVLLWLILYISLYFLYNINISGIGWLVGDIFSLIYTNITMPYFLYHLEIWFATYF